MISRHHIVAIGIILIFPIGSVMTRRSVYPPSATLTGYALEFTLDSSLQQNQRYEAACGLHRAQAGLRKTPYASNSPERTAR